MNRKPSYEELVQRVKDLEKEATYHKKAEADRFAHISFIENTDRFERAIRQATTPVQLMNDVLETALSVFSCDRAWLIFPCDPDAASWSVPMECTRPEYPGAFVLGQDIPTTPDMAAQFKAALESGEPLVFDPETDRPLPDSARRFSTLSSIIMAIYPKIGQPWLWGLSQCSHGRVWKEGEKQLFREIGRRIADALSSLLFVGDLRKSEERFRSLLELTSDWVWETDPNGVFTFADPKVKNLLGYEPEEIIGKPWHVFMDENKAKITAELFREAATKKNFAKKMENTLFHKDGRKLIVETSGIPIFDPDGTLVGWRGVDTDITDRRRAEQELKNSEATLKSIFMAAPIGIGMVSNRVLKWVNERMCEMVGYSTEALLEQSARVLYPSQEEFDRVGAEKYEQIRKWGTGSIETRWKRRDGNLIHVLLSSAPIDPPDLSKGVIFTALDLSERKRSEEETKKLEIQLQQAQKMEAIGTLAGGIAHDFNNILAAIFGYSELAMNYVEKGSLLEESLQEVLVAAMRAKDLVQQILAFSRQTEEELKPVQVKLIVKEAIRLLRSSLPTTIEIRQNIRSQSLVMCNPTQIHQIMINLGTNAGHAMHKKGGVLMVELEDAKLGPEFVSFHPDMKPGQYVKLTVSDTGHGMSQEIIDRIFDPFFTTKEKDKGTGMGMSVVHGIVKSCGGTITVYSELGKGSIFKVLLPAIDIRPEPEVRVEKPIPKGTEHILFVDDEPALVKLAKQILEALGYQVTTRTHSIEALELIKTRAGDFDLVITDMTMPHMTGDEFAENIINVRPDLPIILCTGFSEKITEWKAKRSGIRALISKPILKRDIAATIRKVLDEK